MKKKKLAISPILLKSEERMALEVEKRMAMDEAERFKDTKCVKLVPCAICHAADDEIRKVFAPGDIALKLKEREVLKRTSITICICARCIVKLIENNLVEQVVNIEELRKLLA